MGDASPRISREGPLVNDDDDEKTGRDRKRRCSSAYIESLSFEDVQRYFQEPLKEAAEQLNLSGNTLKRVCRAFGIPKWPFRDIVRLKRSIKNVQNQLQHSTDPQEQQLLQQTLNKMLVQEEMLQSRGALPENETLICEGDARDSDEDVKVRHQRPEAYRLVPQDGLLIRPTPGPPPYPSRPPPAPLMRGPIPMRQSPHGYHVSTSPPPSENPYSTIPTSNPIPGVPPLELRHPSNGMPVGNLYPTSTESPDAAVIPYLLARVEQLHQLYSQLQHRISTLEVVMSSIHETAHLPTHEPRPLLHDPHQIPIDMHFPPSHDNRHQPPPDVHMSAHRNPFDTQGVFRRDFP